MLGNTVYLSVYNCESYSQIYNALKFDTSKISSINVTVSGTNETNDYNYETHVEVFGKTIYNGTHDIVPLNNQSYPLQLRINTYAYYVSATNPSIKFNSFTTTDGKVHTADNLNY